jgi:hypothetical protein
MVQNAKPNPYQFIFGGNPSSGTGQFEYYTGSLKKAIQDSKDGKAGSPFIKVVRGGAVSYQASDNRVKLSDTVGGGEGYLTLTLAEGFQALFYLKTANNDFTEDNVALDHISSDWDGSDSWTENMNEIKGDLAGSWPSVWVQDNAEASDSRTVFGLDSGDYCSFDVDSNSGQVAQFRVRIGGDDYFSNTETDDDIWMTKIWIRKWVPSKPAPAAPVDDNEYQGALEEGGTGDLDGDGVPDGEDIDPYDPDVQEEGDTDYDSEGNVIEPVVIGDQCPIGFIDNGSGICVPDPDYDPEEPPEEKPEDDVSTAQMVVLVLGIAAVVVLAVRVV